MPPLQYSTSKHSTCAQWDCVPVNTAAEKQRSESIFPQDSVKSLFEKRHIVHNGDKIYISSFKQSNFPVTIKKFDNEDSPFLFQESITKFYLLFVLQTSSQHPLNLHLQLVRNVRLKRVLDFLLNSNNFPNPIIKTWNSNIIRF